MSTTSSSEEDLIALTLITDIEEEKLPPKRRLWVREMKQRRNLFKEFLDLFSNLKRSKKEFFKNFRMSKKKFYELLDYLKPAIEHKNTSFRQAVPCEARLAVCLRFLATGDSLRTIALSYHLGETTVRRIVYETCEAIWKVLRPIVMPEPNREIWEKNEEEFRQKWNFPNCLGVINGKHVVFQKSRKNGSSYFDCKKDLSTILFVIVDANYKFTFIDVGTYEKNGERSIFSRCDFGQRLINGQLDFPLDKPLPGTTLAVPYVVVGNESFPLHRNIMRPYPNEQLLDHEDKKVYNNRLSRARNVSEDAFGILSKKFRIYQRRLEITPGHLDKIILATCCLHNFLRNNSKDLFAQICENETRSRDYALEDMVGIGGLFSGAALLVREKFKDYFNSPIGSIEC